MRLTRVQIEMLQDDLEGALNEDLPHGYALEHLHVGAAGAQATLRTPFVSIDLQMAVSCEGDGRVRTEVRASRWLPFPSALVAAAMRRLALRRPGLSVEGTEIRLNLHEAFAEAFHAEEIKLVLFDGGALVEASGVRPSEVFLERKDQGA